MSRTKKNLEEAFAGESQANRRYLAYAGHADREGYTQIAKLFRAAAEAETVHAHAHLKALGEIKTTAENLKTAVEGEIHEFKKMYPDMIEEARSEGKNEALRSFSYANEVEKVHADLYKEALEKMDALEPVDYQVCSVCGYTVGGEAPDVCPVCKSKAQAFYKVA